ncbi:acyl carrier protein [Pendulispora rubella]|uniref:Acyl carrier protein n=1 Tax=Pendulispora rubella TaxID=2741070 RepID=A0ABZ2L5X2_9BACT
MTQLADLSQTIRESIKLYLGVELASDDQHFFAEAGVDSLAFLNVVSAIERKYAIKFSNEALPDYDTCARLARAASDLLERKGP